ncbi:hypothetical protein QO003_003820 [Arthrobacter silviterrae]|uniref:Uncharacterized protein n=1 Tax=Arthrobacter silviterrae TaxID=2026658 RepID=A0ABX0D540_9MICC|nr:hypothetical protein [Arthrobacter silviterrae]MDQ0279517.1 hypothetical protein [Arthrobacter silviterrae]NGN82003.1 hypothetical protein [Arthrobacter silviterrae]
MSRNGWVARTPLSGQGYDPAISAIAGLTPAEGPPPAPDRAGMAAGELVLLAQTLFVDPDSGQIQRQREAVEKVLSWLETFPGQDWQDRWLLSVSDAGWSSWGPVGSSAAQRLPLTTGLGVLLALRVVRPSYNWLFSSRLLGVYDAYRRHNQSETFTRIAVHLSERGGSTEYSATTLNLLACMAMVTGKDLLDLDIKDIADYAEARKSSGRNNGALALAYQVLHAQGAMPDCPPTLVQYHHVGQRTPTELVDRFPIVDRAFRDMLVHYLTERCAMLDYASLINQSQMLAGLFWMDLEEHHPGICSLSLPGPIAAEWKQRLRTLPNGQPRLNYHAILLAVRSFYLDIHQWSLEDPARWAQWAAPCPISQSDTH